MMKKYFYKSTVLLFVLAVLNSKTLYQGALSGIQLWLFTVAPTLFPFLILSDIMIRTNAADDIARLLSPVTRPLLCISPSANYAIITGLLCGYPVGAKACADLVREGKISISEGNYLLTFVNNASPAFISSYIVHSLLFDECSTGLIAALIYIPSILTAFFLNPVFRKSLSGKDTVPAISVSSEHTGFSSEQVIFNALSTLVRIGGYIILFSVICECIRLLPLYPIRIALAGILEITTGTFLVSISTLSLAWRIRLIILFTSFGGISTLCQVNSMMKDSSLSLKWYLTGKVVTAFCAFALSFFLL